MHKCLCGFLALLLLRTTVDVGRFRRRRCVVDCCSSFSLRPSCANVFKLAPVSVRTSSMVEKLVASLRLGLWCSFDPLSSNLLPLSWDSSLRRSLVVTVGGSRSRFGPPVVDDVHTTRLLRRLSLVVVTLGTTMRLSSFTRDCRGPCRS